jgi:PKD repeat protein
MRILASGADFLADFVLAPMEEELEKLPVVDFRSRAPHVDDARAVQFVNTSTGEVTDYLWDFGDGTQSSDKDPLHRYEEPGAIP